MPPVRNGLGWRWDSWLNCVIELHDSNIDRPLTNVSPVERGVVPRRGGARYQTFASDNKASAKQGWSTL